MFTVCWLINNVAWQYLQSFWSFSLLLIFLKLKHLQNVVKQKDLNKLFKFLKVKNNFIDVSHF